VQRTVSTPKVEPKLVRVLHKDLGEWLGDLSLFEKTNGSRQPRFKPVLDLHFKDRKVGSLGWVSFAIVLLAYANQLRPRS
jgi:hypothetical protein